MCKASVVVTKKLDAEVGSTLGIGTVQDHGRPAGTHGAFHKVGETTAQCVHCVQTGERLTLSNIPPAIQMMYGLGDTEVATFVQTDRWDEDDDLVFDTHSAIVGLKELAFSGVEVFVGEKQQVPDIDNAVHGIMASAVEGAKAAEPDPIYVEPAVSVSNHGRKQLAKAGLLAMGGAFIVASILTALSSV